MQADNRVTAITLTAGLSSRMQRCKLNLPFAKHTIIQEVIQQLSDADVAEIIVVTGHYQSEIKELVQENAKIRLVHNPDYQKGMTTSIQCGVKATAGNTKGYMICLSDMPFIKTKSYNKILEEFNKNYNHQPLIVRPFYNEQPGNPTVFSHHFKNEILKLEFMQGAKPLLKKYTDSVLAMDIQEDVVVKDIDTSLDYKNSVG
ncbi:nucleotidyltransferase family protein [Spongiivirga citrea]|uniref:NTP transferase domain-containing protein n=1 Tax=Spongiivirga citrea TaxID=1481457 RepID=A0A6M0CLF4_9FLAO|nr:nucleotidyltransferase family protein [Spongiivirga citrea]NER18758.1 NTP transferase domain-containing protein [Spongiivirga citrea]